MKEALFQEQYLNFIVTLLYKYKIFKYETSTYHRSNYSDGVICV